jgi:dihydrofolate synthase/folylpolyglutamate synthase
VTAGESRGAGWEDYLHSLAVFGMRPGLERVAALLVALGRPQEAFRAIHVVGTNGKSSTTRYCEAVLRAHGARSGAYLSPHITGFAERVLVEGRPIVSAAIGAAVDRVRAESEALPAVLGPVTQFEALTVAAFLALAQAGVTHAAIEAGLGGRLDATNCLHAPVVVLTSVGLDHTEVLGETREAIFAEKFAVVGPGAEVVFGPLEGLEGLARVACRRARARGHFFVEAGGETAGGDLPIDATTAVEGEPVAVEGRPVAVDGTPRRFVVRTDGRAYERLSLPTAAAYQVVNAALAVAACELLLGELDHAAVRGALSSTAVPGRLQVVARRPLVLADGAHNPHGLRALAASLATVAPPSPRVGVVAMMRDKAVEEMLACLAPLLDELVCTRASEARSLAAEELAARARPPPRVGARDGPRRGGRIGARDGLALPARRPRRRAGAGGGWRGTTVGYTRPTRPKGDNGRRFEHPRPHPVHDPLVAGGGGRLLLYRLPHRTTAAQQGAVVMRRAGSVTLERDARPARGRTDEED